MAKCIMCGRRGLFLKLSQAGLCASCEVVARKQLYEENQRKAREIVARHRSEFSAQLAAIPAVPVRAEGQKVPVRSLDGFYDFKYSSVTSRSRRDSLGGYIALDIETAGLKATDAILEVSAVLFSDFVPQSIFTSLVRPSGPIPAAATKVNGITDDMVVSAPYFWQILPDLQAFVGSRPLVGHNLPFDLKFLYRRGFDVQSKQKLYDTLEISQRHLKKANDAGTNNWDVLDHKLETVCKYYKIYIDGAHRSAADALATGLLFAHLVEDRTCP